MASLRRDIILWYPFETGLADISCETSVQIWRYETNSLVCQVIDSRGTGNDPLTIRTALGLVVHLRRWHINFQSIHCYLPSFLLENFAKIHLQILKATLVPNLSFLSHLTHLQLWHIGAWVKGLSHCAQLQTFQSSFNARCCHIGWTFHLAPQVHHTSLPA